MDINLSKKDSTPTTEAEREWMDECEKILNHAMKNLSYEESLRRMIIYGSVITRTDEDGVVHYVDPQDIYKQSED